VSIRAIRGFYQADGWPSLWPVRRPCHRDAHPAQNTCEEYKAFVTRTDRKMNIYISLQSEHDASTLAYTSVSWFVGQTAANRVARDEAHPRRFRPLSGRNRFPLALLTRLPNCQRSTSDAQRRCCLTAILAAHRHVLAVAATTVPNVNKISCFWRTRYVPLFRRTGRVKRSTKREAPVRMVPLLLLACASGCCGGWAVNCRLDRSFGPRIRFIEVGRNRNSLYRSRVLSVAGSKYAIGRHVSFRWRAMVVALRI
jgi:hypothetical protein